MKRKYCIKCGKGFYEYTISQDKCNICNHVEKFKK